MSKTRTDVNIWIDGEGFPEQEYSVFGSNQRWVTIVIEQDTDIVVTKEGARMLELAARRAMDALLDGEDV